MRLAGAILLVRLRVPDDHDAPTVLPVWFAAFGGVPGVARTVQT